MPRYLPELAPEPGATTGTAILLVNLGTPDAPTTPAVRRYLRQFLSDPRVIEIPRAIWLPVLHGIVLATRPAKSARKYARIWTAGGSPLKVHTERQAHLLRERLGHESMPVQVDYAMRYGEPSIPGALGRLRAQGCGRILVLPLYPQYAASTTGSALDEVARFLQRVRNTPEIRTVKHYHDHPAYIAALAAGVREYWKQSGTPDKLVMSFHGLPRYTHEKGDPYYEECRGTARLLAQALQIPEDRWQIAFQSRFGAAEWLQPYTAATLEEYGRQGVGRVDVVCPGFVSDCLETLEEIGIEGKDIFLGAGGREFHLLPCLNERGDWMAALAAIARAQLGDWTEGRPDTMRA
jgi:protoporphyrin/coproporphyrin ferrochelatase